MGEIRTRVYDTALLRLTYPEWPALSDREKYRLLKGREPRRSQRTHNVTCTELHTWLAQAINKEEQTDDGIAKLLVGNGGTTTASGDTKLNNQVVAIDVTDSIYDAGSESSQFDFFMDSATANGETLDELGLESEQGRFVNHAAISPAVDKTSAKTVIFEVTLSFG